MRAFVQVLIIGIFVVILAAAGIFFWVIPRPDVWNIVLDRVLAPYEISVESVAFEHPRYQKYPRSFVKNIQIQFLRENVLWKIHVAQAQVQWEKDQNPVLFLNDVTLHSDECHCEKGYLRLESLDDSALQFQGNVEQCRYAGMVVTDLLANARYSPEELNVPDFRGHLYGGEFTGQFSRENQEPFAYSLNLRVDDIDLDGMNTVNPAVFGQVSGVLRGTLVVKGEDSHLGFVEGKFEIPQHASIRGFLFKYILVNLLQVTEQKKQKIQFDQMVADRAMVPLDRAEVKISSIDERSLRFNIDLESHQYNIKQQVALDVNFDGRYQEFLTLGQSYFSKEKAHVE